MAHGLTSFGTVLVFPAKLHPVIATPKDGHVWTAEGPDGRSPTP